LIGGLLIMGGSARAGEGCEMGKKGAGALSYWPAVFYPALTGGGSVSDSTGLIRTGIYSQAAAPAPVGSDIMDTTVSAGNFHTLVAAVKAAGLVETLKGDCPFTVFTPTDTAFAKIPEAQLNALLADKEALTRVLTYHLVPGKVMAADVVKADRSKTVEGGILAIHTSDGVKVDGANVVMSDILGSNGVIHVIDAVILPS
jgi:uncharacterized surface protein with fasciclin (FAS1) repeats